MQTDSNEIKFKPIGAEDSFGFIEQYLEYAVEDNLITSDERTFFNEEVMNHEKVVCWRFDYYTNVNSEIEKEQHGILSFDIFPKKYLDSIHIFGLDTEGWSPHELDIPRYLHEGFTKHTKRLDRVFFITGNLRHKKYYDEWADKNNFKRRINIIELCNWDTYRSLEATGNDDIEYRKRFFESRKDKLLSNYNYNKYFIYLNRRTRPHRTYLTSEIYHSDLRDKTILSHDNISVEEQTGIVDSFEKLLAEERKILFSKKLKDLPTPLIADITNFEKNYANDFSEQIHLKSLISVVGETIQDDYQDTSMFFSEKTFRPILLGQPFLIWGQHRCHHELFNKLGYKPYNKLFNYEFDSIKHIPSRADALLTELHRVANILDGKTKREQIEWVYQEYETMHYNLMRMRYNEFSMNNFLGFKDNVKELL